MTNPPSSNPHAPKHIPPGSEGAKFLGRKIQTTLTERQLELCKEIVLELVANALQKESPEPTNLQTYADVFDLTQVPKLAEYQDRLFSAPAGAIHPAKRVFAQILQLENADHLLQGILGYLWQIRRTFAATNDNLRGVLYSLMEGEEEFKIVARDSNNREWSAYVSALTPESVVVRRTTRSSKKKTKKKRGKRPNESATDRELLDRARPQD